MQTVTSTTPNRASALDHSATVRWAALTGVISALLALALAEVVSLILGGRGNPVLAVGSLIVDIVPPGFKTFIIDLFDTADKLVLFICLGAVVVTRVAHDLGAPRPGWRRTPTVDQCGGMDLEGRTAVVTGGSRGLGKSMALHLADRGVDIVLTYRSGEAEARKVVEEVSAKGRTAVALTLDVGEHRSAQRERRNVDRRAGCKAQSDRVAHQLGVREQPTQSVQIPAQCTERIVGFSEEQAREVRASRRRVRQQEVGEERPGLIPTRPGHRDTAARDARGPE